MKLEELTQGPGRRGKAADNGHALQVDGRVVALSVVRSARARRFILRIANGAPRVQLTMPLRARISDALEFANSQSGWIAERIAQMPQPVAFEPGAVIPVRGVEHCIVSQAGRRGSVWQETGTAPARLCVAGDRQHLARRVRDWMKKEARKDLDESVAAYAKALGVRPRRISLRDQSSRWGSCSSTGTLSFSWRLILAPPMVLDYVAAHEVAHLREMNHGAAFWAHVGRVCPHMDEAREWLRTEGPGLHRFGTES